MADKRLTVGELFAAVDSGTGYAFALILPHENTEAMQVLLDDFARTTAPYEHVATVLD